MSPINKFLERRTQTRNKGLISRQDKCFVGGEDIEVKTNRKEIYIEVGLFLLIGIICIYFFLTHAELLTGYFRIRKLGTLRSIFIILILSPFGAHLAARTITFCWRKLIRK